MSFKFPYKHPLCILIFMYSIYKALSQNNSTDIKLDLSDFESIKNFINKNHLTGSANANTNKICISSNLVKKMNKRTNVKVKDDEETKQYCIEYDNGDNSYIKNPERRYKNDLDSKKTEWIEQMYMEYIPSNDNKCETYTGKECIYITGTNKENQLKLPLRSLQGYCKGGKPIRWYENTTITCSLKHKTTNINGEITIDGNTINVNLKNNRDNTSITLSGESTDNSSIITDGTITIKEGTIKSSPNTEGEGTGEENTSRNSEGEITSGSIAIESGKITTGTIKTTNENITIAEGKVNSAINSITITEGTITDHLKFDNGKHIDNLIQCCNSERNLSIGNVTNYCKNKDDDTVHVDVWVNDKGEIFDNSTIYCNPNIEKKTHLTINVTFSGNKKK